MTQFDLSLRRGLMDANLAQYERVLRQAEARGSDFSPRYLRERMRLLADPQGWGWRRSRHHGKRLDWRLIAIVAALLLLSACAVAVVTGQFTQWFPKLGVDPAAPEVSEEIASRMGTVVEQSQTADGAAMTLNAAVWDGEHVRLSLVVEAPELPEELTPDSRLYTEECSLELPEEQWKEYVRKEEESYYTENDLPKDQLEEVIKQYLDMGQAEYWRLFGGLNFNLLSREGDTLTFEVTIGLGAFLEKPELALHVENIAIYESDDPVTWLGDKRTGPGPGVSVLKGPFDFSFTLEEPILSISYAGDVQLTYEDIPLRFTRFEIGVFEMDLEYEVLAPVNRIQVTRPDAEPEPPDPNKLDDRDVSSAARAVVRGLWRSDGTYVDLSECGGGLSLTTGNDGRASGSTGRGYPHVIDPATVTAIDLAGTRVELGELERVDE